MTSDLPGISVIIPARDEELRLGAQLRALGAQEAADRLEVVLVDHGSKDRTRSVALDHRSLFGSLDVVDGSQCRGRSDLRNLGVSRSNGGWLAFLDADDLVAEHWLAAMTVAGHRSDVLTGGLVAVPAGWTPVEPRPGPVSRPRFFGHTTLASGNCMVRRDTFERSGGFDPEILNRVDVELSLRLETAGHPPLFVPEAVVYYRARERTSDVMRQHYRWERAGALIYRRYRHDATFAHSNANALKHWARVLFTLPCWAIRPSGRADALVTLASLGGRLVGSIEHRVLWL